MKCPFCNKEIKDDAAFCGFCGKQVPKKHLEEASSAPPANEAKAEVSESVKNVPSDTKEETQKNNTKSKLEKKHTALKVLLIFVLFAFVGGSVLGFLTTRGIFSIESLLPNRDFKWTNFSEGQFETTEIDESLSDKEPEKEENSDISSTVDDEVSSTSSTEDVNLPSETTSMEEIEQPTESDGHYAEYISDSLVVIDDKAHIWDESTIENIFENAKAMSELAEYSIVIAVTNDMFEMTSQEFADGYFEHLLNSNEGDAKPIDDGYLFLINLVDGEYYLSAYGKGIDAYTDVAKDELFNEIHQFWVDGDYEAVVNKIIEKTIY